MQPDLENRQRRVDGQNRSARSAILWVIVILCCGIELTLMAADGGLIGTPLWRGTAYQNGAFWAGLLYNWRPNYPQQPWAMFFTYAFLHSGIWHLLGNMMALLYLGQMVLNRAGQGGFVCLYALSAFGGAAVFGLLTSSPQPMVGASGALFGLAGAWLCWQWDDRRRLGKSRRPVCYWVLGLVGLNLLYWFLLKGMLAWETHLGGFVAGWAGVLFWTAVRPRSPQD